MSKHPTVGRYDIPINWTLASPDPLWNLLWSVVHYAVRDNVRGVGDTDTIGIIEDFRITDGSSALVAQLYKREEHQFRKDH